MVTGSVIAGRGDSRSMAGGPVPAMSKVISSMPGLAFAFKMACRSEPAPLSLVSVTVNGLAKPGPPASTINPLAVRSSSPRAPSTK